MQLKYIIQSYLKLISLIYYLPLNPNMEPEPSTAPYREQQAIER